MKGTRYTDEQIVAALRDAEATSVVAAARKHGVSEQSLHRWRKKFAGVQVSDVRELRRLCDENARLKKLVAERDHDSEPLRCLTVKDEVTGFCLSIKTDRHLQHTHVKALLRELMKRYGRPRAIRSDNGSELLAQALRNEMTKQNIRLANIDPGKPWQNGSNESFNATFLKECLNAEIFASLTEARVVIEQWRRRYNERRPHSSQNYITPEVAYFGLREMRKA